MDSFLRVIYNSHKLVIEICVSYVELIFTKFNILVLCENNIIILCNNKVLVSG